MFKRIGRTLKTLALSFASSANAHAPRAVPQEEVKQPIIKSKGQIRTTQKRGNAAQVKRASKKANNKRKFN